MRDLLNRLGGVAAERVRVAPAPGTARQKDLLTSEPTSLRYPHRELIDGVLVEKPAMGVEESRLASMLVGYLFNYLLTNNIGAVNSGGDAYIKLKPSLIRVPDVWFVRWDKLPRRKFPKAPCPELEAELVVEILSRKNTKRELERKREDFFAHGTRLFWIVDPRKQTVTVYHEVERGVTLGLDEELSGEDVLPGFKLSIREWFQVAEDGTRPPKKK
jgi:Uma2 family endonuclease